MIRAALVRDQRGAVLTEFGLLIVPLCVLLLGMLDVGYAMYARSVLQGAVNDVARLATVQTPDIGGTGTLDERIDAAIRARVAPMAKDATVTITKTNFLQFSAVDQPERLVTDVNGNGQYDAAEDCYEDANNNNSYDLASPRSGIGGADDVAVYDVRFTMPRILPVATLIGLEPNYDIRMRAAVRNQPFANQARPPVRCP